MQVPPPLPPQRRARRTGWLVRVSVASGLMSVGSAAKVQATLCAVGGAVLGGAGYVCYALMFEKLMMPRLVAPGEPTLSYGQQSVMIVLPLAVILGGSLGMFVFWALRGKFVLAVMLPLLVSALVATLDNALWATSIKRYGESPTDLVLYFPLLVGCAITAAASVLTSTAFACLPAVHRASHEERST